MSLEYYYYNNNYYYYTISITISIINSIIITTPSRSNGIQGYTIVSCLCHCTTIFLLLLLLLLYIIIIIIESSSHYTLL